LAARPPGVRTAMRVIHKTVRSVAPGAVEHFSYGMPAFLFEGRILVWYAAHTQHCSLYPIKDAIRRAHAAALRGYETSTGTVRFPHDTAIPTRLVARLVRARLAEVQSELKK
ncbi:MAG TPA: DUF1801 domain-containing protein, partial [Burkholderiaceae bacterium]|nr:DUF1801 domain-containing protein [Burkholderiaceae bacterium]